MSQLSIPIETFNLYQSNSTVMVKEIENQRKNQVSKYASISLNWNLSSNFLHNFSLGIFLALHSIYVKRLVCPASR